MDTENHKTEINVPENKQNARKTIRLLVILSALFLLGCIGLAVYIFSTRSSIQTRVVAQKAISEKEKFKLQLQNLETEYKELGKEYDGLDSTLMQEKEQVRVLLENIEDLEWTASRYKSEITKLEMSLQKFREKVRDLENSNKNLEQNADRYKYSLDSAISILVAEQNKTITKNLSVLKAERLNGEGVKINRKNKEEEVVRLASKTEKIRICFRISQNFYTEKGLIAIYLRVTNPAGLVITDLAGGSGEFIYDNKTLMYSVRKSFYYENRATDMCLYLQSKAGYDPGVYYVDVFIDNTLAGTTTFALD
jgi:septal ring factor EnvC (AmiA/AmiB activator)